MDLNHTELRRELRAVDADNAAAMKPWRETLMRIFGTRNDIPSADKAALLGVPGRRQFFRVGGATLLGAAVLAACGDDDGDAASTGDPDSGDTTDTTEASGGVDDLTLVRTAASLEALAVVAYDTAADSGLVEDAAVGDAAALFRDHHQQHLDALNGAAEANGGEPVTEPNAAVNDAIVAPAVEAASSQADIVQLAYDLEDAAAQTYVFAATVLSTPEFRSTIMTIGGVESRHKIILGNVLALDPGAVYPAAFYESTNPLPEGALVG